MQKEQREHHIFRLLYMILFWVFLRISLAVTGIISLVQWITMWFQDEPIDSLLGFATSLTTFQAQILAYLTFKSEEKVYPFSDWPSSSGTEVETGTKSTETESTETDNDTGTKE